jgi:hypothetical protein
MRDFFDSDWDVPIIIIGGALFLILIIIVIVSAINYSIQDVPMVVKQNKKIIYEGRSACVNVISTGDTTRVDVKGGFLCLFPKAYYVGKNIEAIGIK